MDRKTQTAKKADSRIRNGISLLEVIFAVGVLLIGILGLAAVLPIAANNAQNALDRDRARESYLNQEATRNILGLNDVAKFKSYFYASSNPNVYHPNNPSARYLSVNVSTTGNLPEAFCVDPWFLTAANAVRPPQAQERNNYDRGYFPCYDNKFHPRTGNPADPPSGSMQWGNCRLRRIGISDITNPKYHALLSRDQDTISLIESEDGSRLPGIFAKRSNLGIPVRSNLAGKYSYMMTLRRDGTGNVIVFRDRQIAINPQGVFGNLQLDPRDRHHLHSYTALPFAARSNIPIAQQTFAEERVGYVTYADRVFDGSGGSFVYESSQYVDPSVSQGDWVMLLRRNYTRNQQGDLQFAWCQIGSVDEGPTLNNGRYQTKITVSKLAWRFHPIQSFTRYAGSGPYPPGPLPQGYNQTIFDAAALPASALEYGTTVVLMKNIVSVSSF